MQPWACAGRALVYYRRSQRRLMVRPIREMGTRTPSGHHILRQDHGHQPHRQRVWRVTAGGKRAAIAPVTHARLDNLKHFPVNLDLHHRMPLLQLSMQSLFSEPIC